MDEQQQLVIMIKSPEKQYNAYRVLKVLSNQDYLAVDYHGRYYLLSPLKNRRTATLRPTSRGKTLEEGSRVIQPKECIELDHLHYYVFPIDTAEIVCASTVDASRFNNEEHLFQFFACAVRGILRLLLMRQAKEVRKIIDIKNAIVSRSFLCLLQLDRGKIYPRSIERSQRLGQKKDDTLRKILDNQFKIIKYFGLLLWEIIYKTCLVPRVIAGEERSIVTKLLVSMINKEITFEYLDIKLRDHEERVVSGKEKKGKKFNFLVRSENRYYTQSMNSSNRKTNDRRVETSACSRENLRPCFTRKQRVISEIKTGAEAILSFSRRKVPQFNISKLKWTSTYQSIENKPTFRSSNTKINQKLAKQTEQAKNKFRKFLDARFTLREETDEINEGLRSKLMSKIERFKTEHRSQCHQLQQRQYSFSQNKMEQHYIGHEIEPKRLDFGSERKDVQALQNSQVNINDNIELSEEMVKYINNQTEYVKEKPQQINQPQTKKEEKVQEQPQQKEASTVAKPPPDTTADEMSIQFQQINFKNSANPTLSKELDSFRKLDSDVAATQQTVMKQDKTKQYLKRKQLISETTAGQSDEIEVIKLQKSLPAKQEKNQPPTVLPKKKSEKTQQQITSKQLQRSIDQYEQLIGILGHICSKAKLSKSLGAVTWQKPVYFLFQRFLFEREKFQEALNLGARQVTRDPKSIKDEQWDIWLMSQHRKELLPKIAAQNRQIKEAFNAFAARIVKEVKFDRKIDFYIRNRDKNSNAKGIKFRESLSKLTISFVTEIYDTIIDERINSREVFHFFLDILYGALIICELDNLLTPDKRVLLSNYEKYSYSLDQVNSMIDFVYSLYFQEEQ